MPDAFYPDNFKRYASHANQYVQPVPHGTIALLVYMGLTNLMQVNALISHVWILNTEQLLQLLLVMIVIQHV